MTTTIPKIFILLITLCFLQLSFVPNSFAKESNTVYVTKAGKKYHERDCQTLAKSKNVKAISIQQAKNDGYKPCKVCRPNR